MTWRLYNTLGEPIDVVDMNFKRVGQRLQFTMLTGKQILIPENNITKVEEL